MDTPGAGVDSAFTISNWGNAIGDRREVAMAVIYEDDSWEIKTYSDERPELIRFIHRGGSLKRLLLDQIALWDNQAFAWGPIRWRPLPPIVPKHILWRVELELRNRSN